MLRAISSIAGGTAVVEDEAITIFVASVNALNTDESAGSDAHDVDDALPSCP